jgi:hypothetical protein
VVIPIGCIAARDSLEELALMHGSSGGSFDPDAGASESDYAVGAIPAEPGVLSATGDRISGVFSMAFYMLQGLVTLIWFTFKGLFSRFTRKSVDQVTPEPATRQQPKDSKVKSAVKQKAPVKKAVVNKKIVKKAVKAKAVSKTKAKKKDQDKAIKTATAIKKPSTQAESIEPAAVVNESKSTVVPKKKTQLKKKIHIKQSTPDTKTAKPVPKVEIAPEMPVESETKKAQGVNGTNTKKVRPEPVKKETGSIAAPKRPQLRKRRGIRLKPDVQGFNERQH